MLCLGWVPSGTLEVNCAAEMSQSWVEISAVRIRDSRAEDSSRVIGQNPKMTTEGIHQAIRCLPVVSGLDVDQTLRSSQRRQIH